MWSSSVTANALRPHRQNYITQVYSLTRFESNSNYECIFATHCAGAVCRRVATLGESTIRRAQPNWHWQLDCHSTVTVSSRKWIVTRLLRRSPSLVDRREVAGRHLNVSLTVSVDEIVSLSRQREGMRGLLRCGALRLHGALSVRLMYCGLSIPHGDCTPHLELVPAALPLPPSTPCPRRE